MTASHQVLQRFTELFPKVRRKTWRNRAEGQDRVTTYLHGINFVAEIPKVGSPGSPCTNKNAANPVIESQKNGDPTQHHRVTGESPGVTAGSPPPPNGDPYPGSGDSPLDRVTAQGHHSEIPMNTKLKNLNAVHGDPGDPDLQILTQQKTGAPPPVNCGQKFKLGQMVRYTGRDPELRKQLPAPAPVTSVQPWDKTLWVQRPSGGDVTVPMADVEVAQ